MADWDPELYNRFQHYRAEPVEMILARLRIGPAERIADLGCGSGENTVDLARRSAGGSATGIDSSPAMIDRALKLRATLAPDLASRVSFVLGDLRNFSADGEYTIVFSNAAMQWVGGHREVLRACFRALRPGGQLVVQMPANEGETAQVTIQAMASEAPWNATLGAVKTPSNRNVSGPEVYRTMLEEVGFVEVDCHYHTFRHPMQSPAEVIEFYRATGLRPFLEGLVPDQRGPFIAELTRRLQRAYGTRGALTFNFRRLFLWARRPSE
ncbi:MAG TPA: methyltransferase domain-containing protein [Candidatus Binataceae bacterium]|nr:methyltransferase domain-containing protein [Candidatus Binataceae bacterium]